MPKCPTRRTEPPSVKTTLLPKGANHNPMTPARPHESQPMASLVAQDGRPLDCRKAPKSRKQTSPDTIAFILARALRRASASATQEPPAGAGDGRTLCHAHASDRFGPDPLSSPDVHLGADARRSPSARKARSRTEGRSARRTGSQAYRAATRNSLSYWKLAWAATGPPPHASRHRRSAPLEDRVTSPRSRPLISAPDHPAGDQPPASHPAVG
jgi:hypothetical protein